MTGTLPQGLRSSYRCAPRPLHRGPPDAVKLATFNINNIVRRLPVLLRWLERESPDVVCLQETKVVDEALSRSQALRDAGYGARWHGQRSWNGVAILARDAQPIETRRGLPGDPGDQQSRYLEAAVNGVLVGCLYLPNGNPQPGAEVRLQAGLVRAFPRPRPDAVRQRPSGGAGGRLQRHPDRLRHLQHAVLAEERPAAAARAAPGTSACWTRAGWTPSAPGTPTSPCTPSGTTSAKQLAARRGHAPRPHPARPDGGAAAGGSGRRPLGAGPARRQRSRPRLGRPGLRYQRYDRLMNGRPIRKSSSESSVMSGFMKPTSPAMLLP